MLRGGVKISKVIMIINIQQQAMREEKLGAKGKVKAQILECSLQHCPQCIDFLFKMCSLQH